MSDTKADAPKLRAQWGRKIGFRVVPFERRLVDALALEAGRDVPVEIKQTPLAQVAHKSDVMSAFAHQDDSGTARLAIVRNDPADAPDFVNVDMYTLVLDVRSHPEFPQLVEAASTSDNENMRAFATRTALLLKHKAGGGFRHRWNFVPSAEQVFTSTGGR